MRRELTCVSSPRSRSPLKHNADPMAYTNRRVDAFGPVIHSQPPPPPPPFKCLRPSQRHHQGVIESASGARPRRRHHRRTPQIPRRMDLKSQKKLLSRRRHSLWPLDHLRLRLCPHLHPRHRIQKEVVMMHQSRIQRSPLQYRNAPTPNLPKPETGASPFHLRRHRQTHHLFYLRRGPVIEPRTSRLCEIDLDNSGWRPWLTRLQTI